MGPGVTGCNILLRGSHSDCCSKSGYIRSETGFSKLERNSARNKAA